MARTATAEQVAERREAYGRIVKWAEKVRSGSAEAKPDMTIEFGTYLRGWKIAQRWAQDAEMNRRFGFAYGESIAAMMRLVVHPQIAADLLMRAREGQK